MSTTIGFSNIPPLLPSLLIMEFGSSTFFLTLPRNKNMQEKYCEVYIPIVTNFDILYILSLILNK